MVVRALVAQDRVLGCELVGPCGGQSTGSSRQGPRLNSHCSLFSQVCLYFQPKLDVGKPVSLSVCYHDISVLFR